GRRGARPCAPTMVSVCGGLRRVGATRRVARAKASVQEDASSAKGLNLSEGAEGIRLIPARSVSYPAQAGKADPSFCLCKPMARKQGFPLSCFSSLYQHFHLLLLLPALQLQC